LIPLLSSSTWFFMDIYDFYDQHWADYQFFFTHRFILFYFVFFFFLCIMVIIKRADLMFFQVVCIVCYVMVWLLLYLFWLQLCNVVSLSLHLASCTMPTCLPAQLPIQQSRRASATLSCNAIGPPSSSELPISHRAEG